MTFRSPTPRHPTARGGGGQMELTDWREVKVGSGEDMSWQYPDGPSPEDIDHQYKEPTLLELEKMKAAAEKAKAEEARIQNLTPLEQALEKADRTRKWAELIKKGPDMWLRLIRNLCTEGTMSTQMMVDVFAIQYEVDQVKYQKAIQALWMKNLVGKFSRIKWRKP